MNKTNNSKSAKVIIPTGVKPWPHELRVAKILVKAGHRVEFIPEGHYKAPDIYLNNTMYEIKSPISNKIDSVQRNLTRALSQSHNIIFDASRTKLKDAQIVREIVKRRREGKGLRKILFINKQGKIIDIEDLL